MTKLSKPVRRRVDIDRGLVVTLYPNRTIGLRPSRCRREHLITLARVYQLAVQATIESDRKIKAAKKRESKGLPPLRRLVSRGLLSI